MYTYSTLFTGSKQKVNDVDLREDAGHMHFSQLSTMT